MSVVTLAKWCTLPCLLFGGLAQDVPDSARKVFSHGIIPVMEPDQQPIPLPAPPVDPETVPAPAPPAAPESRKLAVVEAIPPAELDKGSREVGETAWRYFEPNLQTATGWFDSVRHYSYTTMWDLSSGIAAVACAEKLGIISRQRAVDLLGSTLRTLTKIQLYNAELPNREYNTKTAAISGPKAVGLKGTGWSALDLGRLLIWLKIVAAWYPEYADLTHEIVQRWKFERLAQGGEMLGTYYADKHEYRRQEGRLGYEQYSASGYELWGISMQEARGYRKTKPVEVLGVDLAADQRNVPFLTSEPFLLAAFELGTIDPNYTSLTRNLYRAQQQRWETTHVLTAASEDSMDRAPWFAYFNVYYQGQPWQCRSHSGEETPAACGFSAKAAFGWAALFNDAYTRILEKKARSLKSPAGYEAGEYPDGQRNTNLNINTNAVILEAMLYRRAGRHAFLETNQ